jgi:hypothetical protein
VGRNDAARDTAITLLGINDHSGLPQDIGEEMKKIIIGVMAVAMLAIPSIASADVKRCEASITTDTTVTTATFTALQPKDTTHQFDNVWKHDFTVTVNAADNTFIGTSTVSDNGGSFAWDETVTGSFNADRTLISFETLPFLGGLPIVDGATFKVTNAPYNVSVDVESNWTANTIEMKITTPSFKTSTTTTPGAESVKNHGQFVKAQGGGKEAAQACAGMPTNSTQGKK